MTNLENIIDSREVIERIEELEQEIIDAVDEIKEIIAELESEKENLFQEEQPEGWEQSIEGIEIEIEAKLEEIEKEEQDSENKNELDSLISLAEEGENASSDWQYGATLIRDDYFEDYARELAEDTGRYSSDEPWPLCCIDWEKAANLLKMDYTEVDYDGVSYWVRS